MTLDIQVLDLIQRVGHDGSEIVWPGNPEPHNRRGFHPQEMIHVAYRLDKRVITFEKNPTSVGLEDSQEFSISTHQESWRYYLEEEIGVLAGYFNGRSHAVAWDGMRLIDNDGIFYPLRLMNAHTFFAVKNA